MLLSSALFGCCVCGSLEVSWMLPQIAQHRSAGRVNVKSPTVKSISDGRSAT